MRILIIEDEKLPADSLQTMLEKKGFAVECAYDGESGAAYAELGVYDLLLSAPLPCVWVSVWVRQKLPKCSVTFEVQYAKNS